MSKPIPPLTDALRHALSVAMGHPDDWEAEDIFPHNVHAQFGETAPPFVVERIAELDNDYVYCEGHWPSMPITVEIFGNKIIGTTDLKWGGNISLNSYPTLAALL